MLASKFDIESDSWIESHIGESLPDVVQNQRVVIFQADGDELELIKAAYNVAAGFDDVLDYSKMQGFRAKANEELVAAASEIYLAAWWTPDRNVDAKRLWIRLRDALGLTSENTPKRLLVPEIEPEKIQPPVLPADSRVNSVKWLIEFRGARPAAAYAQQDGETFPTLNPWKARAFDTREQAKQYMLEHGYGSPWHETEHIFGAIEQ